MKKSIFVILLLLTTCLHAQNCTIKGTANGCEGKLLYLQCYEDEIVFNASLLDSANVSNDTFCFKFQTDETLRCFINYGNKQILFFIEPNETLEIKLPTYEEISDVEKQNPFFTRKQIYPPLPNSNITQKVMAFDDEFDYYYSLVSLQPDTANIQKTIAQINGDLSKENNSFVLQYKQYENLLLLNLNGQQSPYWAIDSLRYLPVNRHNPAFWEAFNNIFDSFLTAFGGRTEQPYFDRVVFEANYKAFDAILLYRFGIANAELRELIIIKSLYDLYFSNERSNYVFSLMKAWASSLQYDANKKIMDSIIDKIQNTQKSQTAFNFTLKDADAKEVSLSDFTGKYILLNFCDSQNSIAHRNMEMIKRYTEIYEKDLVAITIFTDQLSESKQKSLTKQYASKNSVVLFCTDNTLLQKYDVVNLPTYYLLDREKRFALSDFSMEEQFEERFVDLLQKDERTQQTKPKGSDEEWWK